MLILEDQRPLYYIMNSQQSWDRDILKQKIQDGSITWNQLTKGFGNKKNLLKKIVKLH